MTIARSFACLTCVFALTPAVLGDQTPLSDPKDILRQSKEAMSKCKTVSYDATVEATEWAKQFVPDVRGKAVVGPPAKYDVPRFYCEVAIKRADSEETFHYKAGCDGDDYFLIDPATKKAHQDLDPVVLGKNSRDIQRVVVGAFFDKDAFKEELEAEGLELRGTVEVGGEQCYEVYSPVKTPPQKAIAWAISAEDLLPRRITRYYASREPGGPDGSTMVTMTNLAANPKQAGDPFKLSVPEGYTKTDEFAP